MFERIKSNVNYISKTIKKKSDETLIFNKESKNVWIFNAGNLFTGNPKWLFIYVNKYRKDIDAFWMCDSEETINYVKKLGYKACLYSDPMSMTIREKTSVFVVENVKEHIPRGLEHVTMLNLFHGVGCKSIERKVNFGFLNERIAKKYITYNQFYKNNQLFLVTSPLMEKHFKEQCGIDDDKVIRAGYPRCEYNKYCEKIETFDHDILKQKGLPSDTKVVVYSPTYRDESPYDFFGKAIPDMDRLIKKLEENNMLMIFKMHPLMEKDYQYVQCKEYYADNKNILFWDNNLDFYEVMDQVDLAIIDYSSIFYDMLAAGVKNFVRYMFDYEDNNFRDLVFDVKEMTCGTFANNFDELIESLDTYKEDSNEERERIYDLFWNYAGKDSLETIVNQTLAFKPEEERELSTLYSFDIFDTVFTRKVLEPQGIFYYVKEQAEKSNLGFGSFFTSNYINIRKFSEANVREFYHKTLTVRKSDRREITFDEIFDNMQALYNLTDEQVSFLKEKELEAELDNVIPMYERIGMIERLIENGDTVVLISDMYLSKEMITKMLEKANPILTTIPLFLSSDYGVQKTTKKLFLEVYRSFEEYNFKEWIHYGDNAFADGKMPKQLGIKSVVHKVLTFNEYETALTQQINSYESFLLAAKMARFRETHFNKKDYFAYAYISLYFVPYVNWAIGDAMARGIDTLYFISRDGYQLKRIADTIIEEKNYKIKTKYIYGSRKAWRVPSFVNEIDEEFFSPFGNFTDVRSFDKLLKALNMDEQTFDEYFPQLAYVKELEEIDKPTMNGLVNAFSLSEKYHEYLLNYAKEGRKIVLEYLNQEIDFEEKFAFVEYWGRGYTQDCFTRLVHAATGKELDVPYYYVRSIYPTQGHNVRYNFSGNRTPLLFVESIFANIPYKSITSYKYEDGKIVPELVEIECDKELFSGMKRYLVQFTKDYLKLNVDNQKDFDYALFNFGLNYFAENQSDDAFASCLAPLVDSVGTYGEKNEYAPALNDVMLKAMENGEKLNKMTRSVDMTLARSSEEMIDKYNYLTTVVPAQRKQAAQDEKLQKKQEADIEKDCKFRSETRHFVKVTKNYQQEYNHMAKAALNPKLVIIIDTKTRIPKPEFYELKKILAKDSTIKVVELHSKERYHEDELRLIATAKAIITKSPCIGVNRLSLRKETKFVQLHECAFMRTKYGLAREYPNAVPAELELKELEMKGNYDLIPVASNKVVKDFEAAYKINKPGVVTPIGSCVTDAYFDEEYKEMMREELYKKFPQAEGKKIIFYMPYYRFHKEPYKKLEFLDIPQMYKKLKDEYVLIIHSKPPEGKTSYEIASSFSNFAIDLAGKLPIRGMFMLADIFVGDYRNALFETPLLHKPVFMTANDYSAFDATKQINYTCEDVILGPLVFSTTELINKIKNVDDYDYEMIEQFKETYLENCDGKASERLVKLILE